MTEFLVFQLYGPLASWGEAAGGSRPSDPWPTRSALVGLLGNAMGYERSDEMLLSTLADDFSWTMQMWQTGNALIDYHTVQTPRLKSGRTVRSRREALFGEATLEVVTSLTQREYRTDSFTRVAVSPVNDNTAVRLEALADALAKPARPLYLGRKSCPPGAPLAPRVVDARHAREALGSYHDLTPVPTCLRTLKPQLLAFDSPDDGASRSHFRRDVCTSRKRWQFARRQEWISVEEGR